jgi:hypothetical protein
MAFLNPTNAVLLLTWLAALIHASSLCIITAALQALHFVSVRFQRHPIVVFNVLIHTAQTCESPPFS